MADEDIIFCFIFLYKPSNCRNKKNPYRCDPYGGEGPLNGETVTDAARSPNCNDSPSILPTTQCLTGAWLPRMLKKIERLYKVVSFYTST